MHVSRDTSQEELTGPKAERTHSNRKAGDRSTPETTPTPDRTTARADTCHEHCDCATIHTGVTTWAFSPFWVFRMQGLAQRTTNLRKHVDS